MAWKNLKQRSLADSMMIEHQALKELDSVNELIDWSRLERFLQGIHARTKGERSWPPLLMFKALLLQSWYGLSDPALVIAETVPDHSTFWRFRQTLERLKLMGKLLNEINQQLTDQGLYIKSGGVSIIDASVIEAPQCRPNKGKDGQPTQDPEADWNVKTGSDGKRKSTYGYKAHINVDEDGSGHFYQRFVANHPRSEISVLFR